MKIQHLSRENILEKIDQLKKIDDEIIDIPWKEENFLKELNGKWEYSFSVMENDIIEGFAICSLKNEDYLHIHRLALSREYQRRGIGKMLIQHILDDCYKSDIKHVTVRTKKINKNAQRFYEKEGFNNIGADGDDYIYQKVIK